MKNIKKLASLLLAIMMVLCTTTVLATDVTSDNNGSITINGVGETSTYAIYRLLDLESYNEDTGAYSYTVNSDWAEFFATDEAKAYFAVDASGYATWINSSDADAVVAEFAKKALAYAKANDIDPVMISGEKNEEGTYVPTGDFAITGTSGVFSDLVLGYYLVDSSVGALCGLTTTNPDASINAKNGIPTIDKQVEEDSTNSYGDGNTADIGQIVNFKTIVNVHAGAENYVLHDKMSEGLTFQEDSVRVVYIDPSVSSTEQPVEQEGNYTIETATDGCTFEVVFKKEFTDTLKNNDKIVVYYSAMLNRDALIAGDGNPNESWLEFGEENYSNHDQTTTKTFGFDIVKTDSQNKLIDGAEFRIYDAKEGGNIVGVVELTKDEEGNVTVYRRARTDEGEGDAIVVKGGKVRVVGFDNGTYYLEETKTPAGYNQLSERVGFTISDANMDAIFNGDIFSTGSGVHVVNKTGTMLPETGGMGTTLFYACGGVLVLAAVVLLVTKKRMSNAE